jgi:Pyruvate/2-oxoacid:ferredoxin oxidoreductase delta subunit
MSLLTWSPRSSGLERLPPPEVDAARCVHSLVAAASCRRCADACPARAWVIDDESLGIDVQRCDGCGICSAVCPQQALAPAHGPFIVAEQAQAFAACQRAASSGEAGVIPCLHALDERGLLDAYARGVRRLHVARGECEDCPRSGVHRLEATLAAVSDVIASCALPPLDVQHHATVRWRAARDEARTAMAVQPDRRCFLWAGVADALARVVGGADGSRPHPAVRARGYADSLSGAVFLWAPEFDVRRCIACDACVRVCPSGALGEDQAGDAVAYRIRAESCTGCQLCRDVCEQAAIAVNRRSSSSLSRLELAHRRCRGCGVEYRTVACEGDASAGDADLCRICRLTGRNRRLFQVMGG